MPRVRQLAVRQHMHEWLLCVGLRKNRVQLFGRTLPSPHVNRRQDAPVHRHQMRRERHDDLTARGLGEFLVKLGHVTVMTDAIGIEAFRHFGKQHRLLRRPPCPGHARLGVDHDLVRIDGFRLQQRNERQLRAGGVTAGIGDKPRLLDLAAIDLDEAIYGLLLKLRCVMLVAVPLRIGFRRQAGNPPRDRRPSSPAPCRADP